MKLKLLGPVILSILIVNPSYSVSEQEFNEMKELLQNALIKINALEQAQKQNLSNSKSNVITKADKLSINTSGGGIKIKSGDQKFAIGGRLMMDYDYMASGHQTENKSFSDIPAFK